MRRGFSIFLILLFGLGPLTATLSASDDASLPPCCRRHGAHHCAMAARALAPSSKPAFTAPLTCPYYPHALAPLVTAPHALATTAAALTGLRIQLHTPYPESSPALLPPSPAHAGRGPPDPDYL